MKVPVAWLNEYVSPLPPVDELADRLTMLGLEVDGVERTGAGLEKILVGKILEMEPHPNADRLTLCQVTVGNVPLQVVCGAHNMKAGDYVAVSQPGTTLPNGVKLKKSKIRGVESQGMLCAEDELGLGDDHNGIIILEGEPKVGSPFAEVYDLVDDVIEIDLTPNRGDCLSMMGVAREVAASFELEMKRPEVEQGSMEGGPKVTLEADAVTMCPRYTGIAIENVKIGPSPRWLARRLERAGVRSINNVVDATNHTMLEYGQPPHAFDADTLHGNEIVVRMAREGEKLTVIDGSEVTLTPEDMVIADADRPVALAGVMGGAETEVSETTTRVLLENAFFTPIPVRRKAKKYGFSTDASQRFERGANLAGVVEAAWRCAHLIAELSGGRIVGGMTCVDGPDEVLQPFSDRVVEMRPSRVEHLLGVAVKPQDIRTRLEGLGLTCKDESQDCLRFDIPGRRHDLEREVDLIEEVARTVGYDTFPSTVSPMPFTGEYAGVEREETLERMRRVLSGNGWREAVTYSFVPRASLELWSSAKPPKVANPLSQQQEVMRTSLVPSLLDALVRNHRRGMNEVALYEFGRIFEDKHEGLEPMFLAGVSTVPRDPSWRGSASPAERDLFDVKGDINALFTAMGIRGVRWEGTQKPPALHPGFASRAMLNETDLGYLGVLHPEQVAALELTTAPVVFQLDTMALLEACQNASIRFQQPSEFPAVTRDLALVVPSSVDAADVQRTIEKEAGKLLESCRLFDLYTGDQTGGEVSLGFRYVLRSTKDTLKEKAVEKTEERILLKLQREYGITRRQ